MADESRRAAKFWGLRNTLASTLSSVRKLIRASEQQQIKYDDEVVRSMFRPKPCLQLGLCVCGANPRGRTALQIHGRLAARLKEICWSRKKEKSPQRVLLESAFLVLRLFSDESPEWEMWLHIGYANYKTWRLTVHRLQRVPEDLATAAGFVSAHAAGILLRSTSLAAAVEDANSTECFQTSVHAIFQDVDAEKPLSMQLYTLLASNEQVPDELMPLGFVEVCATRSNEGTHLQCKLWQGEQAEAAIAAAVRRPRARAPGPARAAQRRQGGQPAPLSQRIPSHGAEAAAVHAHDSGESGEDSPQHDEEADAEVSSVHSVAAAGSLPSDMEQTTDEEDDPADELARLLEANSREEDLAEAAAARDLPEGAAKSASSDESSSSSSSSSSSDSSDSSDSDSAVAESEADAGSEDLDLGDVEDDEEVERERAPPQREDVYTLEEAGGEIHYNHTGCFFRAHCAFHGDECRRQRTARPSDAAARSGQGRPLGLLVSWLLRAHEAEGAQEHITMKASPLGDRQEARRHLYGMRGGRAFANKYERCRRMDEAEPDEPLRVP